jgi:formylglycine-generating enzyme required for sulfatase activity
MMGRAESIAKMKADFPYLDQIFSDKTMFIKEYVESEQPQHKIRITRPFYIGAHNVTFGQFAKFVTETGYTTEAEQDGKGGSGVTENSDNLVVQMDPKFNWKTTGFEQQDDHPVVNVSWNDAIAFCKWLTAKERMKFRLPTEAEWEYACRAGTTTRYYFGDDPSELVQAGNVYDYTLAKKLGHPQWEEFKPYDDGFAFTSPVDQFKANPFGLYDIHGNAATWCADWFSPFYYAKSPTADPQGPETPGMRVVRGGSWIYIPLYARSAYRVAYRPSHRDGNIGFRVVLEVDIP